MLSIGLVVSKERTCLRNYWPKWNVPSSLRPANPPRKAPQQQPPTETAIQEPDEEILGSDDEEQEDPNDYCKGKRHAAQ